MSRDDTMLALVMAEAKPVIKAEDSLEDRCRAAMRACYRHWGVTDEDLQFRGAVAAVYVATDDLDEKDRIEAELNLLRNLAAMLEGVPVNLDAIEAPENPIGLRKMWTEVTVTSALTNPAPRSAPRDHRPPESRGVASDHGRHASRTGSGREVLAVSDGGGGSAGSTSEPPRGRRCGRRRRGRGPVDQPWVTGFITHGGSLRRRSVS